VDQSWRFGADNLMVSLSDLSKHHQDGKPSLDKPLALCWAIGRLAADEGPLFTWPAFREGVGDLLTAFGANRTPEYPFWHLHSSPFWETHGLTGPPTRGSEARAGFTPAAADLLADQATRAQALDVLRAAHLADIDQRTLFRLVGLPLPTPPDAFDVLQGLVGREIKTVTGFPNHVLAVDRANVLVRTGRSEEGQPVPLSEVQHGIDLLYERGRVAAHVDVLRYRSAFVAAVLATLPRAVVSRSPAAVSLGAAPTTPDRDFGVLDRTAVARYRVEQEALRQALVGNARQADCALCGRTLPVELLVAAHIKRRSDCDDTERRDLRNVAMLACHLGCDRLYELGYVTVDAHGTVRTADATGAVAEQLAALAGRRTDKHGPATERYFAWHRTEVFRPVSGTTR
jgi:hypothetical protein